MSNQRILIIDGHSMAFRAFFALPVENFNTTTGQPTNAIYGFLTMMLKLVETHKPTHLVVAFDTSRHSFRTEIYPDYKGGRAATPEEFKGQVPLLKQVLDAARVARVELDGFEADDLLATIAHQGEKAGMEVLLASGDRDTFQLITPTTSVIYPGRSTSDLRVMDPAAVEEKYQVGPQQYPELAALVGESADNLPGVPLVGEKTAAQWLAKYGSLEELLERADEIGGKRGQNLRDHIEDVRRNRRLNALLTDVEVPLSLEQMQRQPVDRVALEDLFDTLEFSSLRQRVFKTLGAGEDVASVGAQSAAAKAAGSGEESAPAGGGRKAVKSLDASEATAGGEGDDSPYAGYLPAENLKLVGDLSTWLEGVDGQTPVAIHAEYGGGDITALVLASQTTAVNLDPTRLNVEDDAALAQFLATHPAFICHHGKELAHLLNQRGWTLSEPVFDTQLAAYLLRPEQRDLSLSAVAERYLGVSVSEEDNEGQLSLLEDPTVAAQDARTLLQLASVLRTQLENTGGWQLLKTVELPVQSELFEMERTGIAMSIPRLQDMSEHLRGLAAKAQQGAFDAIGREVNLASPMQLQSVLFDQLKMPKTKKTKRGYTTNAEALTQLLAQTDHPFLRYLLEHRDKTKLAQIVDGLASAVEADGRIHTTFQQTITATGRLSSMNPNLQNIPARTAEGLQIRHTFIPGEGFESLMTADYSQIEMRIMAHMSEDAELIAALNSGEDLHRTMAAMVFGVPVQEVTGEQRSRIKATSYGLAYGLSSYGLSQQLGISVPQAKQLRDRYFQRFGGIGRFLGQVVEEARERGYTQTLMGRRRYLPDLESSSRQRREMAERAALNAPIQGSAADIIKVAMVEVARALRAQELSSRVLLQVHDELVLEVAPGEEAAVRQLVAEMMGKAASLEVPLEVSIGVGESWMEAAH
ncbi:MAG: DNA polymerase I [Actinomycetaceae bacterium]|nr:DNA polymerase I [Actinomycetaceae bacterium]